MIQYRWLPEMVTHFMMLAIYNRPRLNFEQTCEAIGVTKATGYSWRTLGKFPVPMMGVPLSADIRDVADYLDEMRAKARREFDTINRTFNNMS
jgi:hypothetical protein